MGCCLWLLRLQCMIWTSLSVLMICMDIRLENEALVAVSEAVRSRLCEDEILARWRGEEFIVIMKQNERRFEEHAQEIREAVEQLQLETV